MVVGMERGGGDFVWNGEASREAVMDQSVLNSTRVYKEEAWDASIPLVDPHYFLRYPRRNCHGHH